VIADQLRMGVERCYLLKIDWLVKRSRHRKYKNSEYELPQMYKLSLSNNSYLGVCLPLVRDDVHWQYAIAVAFSEAQV
jgi:hypothetical protein